VRLLLVAGAALLLLGGCGGDDDPVVPRQPDLGSAAAEAARTCLGEAGLEVLGGSSDPGDRDAPDIELTAPLDGGQLFVAFYADAGEAAAAESAIRGNAADFGGVVERRGSTTIVWSEPPSADSRETVVGCVFG
jgi:hypothetical protein